MRRKLLTTILLTISLLSLNLYAGSKMKCTGNYCVVDLSGLSSERKKVEVKTEPSIEDSYTTIILDNIETIIFERYVMTQNEVAEYELEEMQKNLLVPSLNLNDLPSSDYLCEDNLKPVKVVGIDNTYHCT